MGPIIDAVIEAYRKVPPRDVQDGVFYLSEATEYQLRKETVLEGSDITYGSKIFGRPMVIDDSMPFGAVSFLAETELDRVIRRATDAGRSVYIPKIENFWAREIPTPTPPTLKALLKKWWKRIKR